MSIARIILSILTVFIGTSISYWVNGRYLFGIDDANIYFIYMRNFAEGHGFVYNIGSEKVEGFTSLLWTLIGSLFYKISSSFNLILLSLNILLSSVVFYKIFQFIEKQFQLKVFNQYSIIISFLAVFIHSYFDWNVLSLLETGLWSFLLIFASLVLMKEKISKLDTYAYFPILIAAMILTRPESMLWCLFFIAFLGVKSYLENGNIKTTHLKIAPSIIIYLATLTLLTLWRIDYFGFPLPNTYYAKVSSNRIDNAIEGFLYLAKSFWGNPILPITLLLSSIKLIKFLIQHKLKNKFNFVFLWFVLFVSISIPMFTGGDHFGYSRFLQPTMLLVYLLFVMTLVEYRNLLKLKFAYIIIGLLIIFSNYSIIKSLYKGNSYIAHEWIIAENGKKKSNLLNNFFNDAYRLPSQGVVDAGARAYFYSGFTYDLMGLNNIEIAHSKKSNNDNAPKNHSAFSKEVFYKQLPDLLWYSAYFTENKNDKEIKLIIFDRQVLKNIHKDTEFKGLYHAVKINNISLDYSLVIFAKKEFLESLESEIYSIEKVRIIEASY